MKKFIILIILIAISSMNCLANEIVFHDSQSYEMAYFINEFASLRPSSGGNLVEKSLMKDAFTNIYYTENQTMRNVVPKGWSTIRGEAGILFYGKGYEKTKQLWNNGYLENIKEVYGFGSSVTFECPTYWGVGVASIGIFVSPAYIREIIASGDTDHTLNLNVEPYFTAFEYGVTLIDHKGNMSNGKSLWELKSPDSDYPVYLIVSTSCGASGRFGTTAFDVYYKKKLAVDSYYKN